MRFYFFNRNLLSDNACGADKNIVLVDFAPRSAIRTRKPDSSGVCRSYGVACALLTGSSIRVTSVDYDSLRTTAAKTQTVKLNRLCLGAVLSEDTLVSRCATEKITSSRSGSPTRLRRRNS